MKRNSIFSSTLIVSTVVLVTKVFGVVKKSLIAALCGATLQTDLYFLTTGITILIGSMLFSSVSISLLTMCSLRLVSKGEESVNDLMNATLRFFLPVAILLSALTTVFAPFVARILAPAYSGTALQQLTYYVRMMAVMLVFMCWFHLLNIILEIDKRFLPGMGYGLFQNVFTCIAVLFFYKQYGMISLFYAFLLAGFVQCVQIAWSARNKFHPVWKPLNESKAIRQLVRLSLPLFIGNAIYEINDIIDKQIATGLGGGGVSILSYGSSINEMVTTMIITSVSTVLLAFFAEWISNKEIERVRTSLLKAVKYLIVLILPVMIMCFICGDCIVDILYGRGQFDNTAIVETTKVVYAYAAGFIFQAVRAILIRVYYAFQDMKTPMINGGIAVGVNIILSIILSRKLGAMGISLATSIAMLLVSMLLMPGLRKHIPDMTLKPIMPECIKAVCAAIAVGTAAYMLRSAIQLGSVWTFLIIGLFIMIVYVGMTSALKITVFQELLSRLK